MFSQAYEGFAYYAVFIYIIFRLTLPRVMAIHMRITTDCNVTSCTVDIFHRVCDIHDTLTAGSAPMRCPSRDLIDCCETPWKALTAVRHHV